jgi:hypothetical protein
MHNEPMITLEQSERAFDKFGSDIMQAVDSLPQILVDGLRKKFGDSMTDAELRRLEATLRHEVAKARGAIVRNIDETRLRFYRQQL